MTQEQRGGEPDRRDRTRATQNLARPQPPDQGVAGEASGRHRQREGSESDRGHRRAGAERVVQVYRAPIRHCAFRQEPEQGQDPERQERAGRPCHDWARVVARRPRACEPRERDHRGRHCNKGGHANVRDIPDANCHRTARQQRPRDAAQAK